MELIKKEDAIMAITRNLDRINNHPDGTGLFVASDWLKDVPCVMKEMMSDLINRQAVIDSFRSDDDGTAWSMDDIVYRLEQFPSAQPERKKGKWIPQDHNKHHGMMSTAVYYLPRCSMCGESADYTNFCPNCGADMRGEQDEQ